MKNLSTLHYTARFGGHMMRSESLKKIGRYYHNISTDRQNEDDMLGDNLVDFPMCSTPLIKQLNVVVNNWHQGPTNFQEEMAKFADTINIDEIMQGDVPPGLVTILRECRNELSELTRKLCWRYLVMPPEEAIDLPFLESWGIGIEHLSSSHAMVQKGIAQFRREVRGMTISEYVAAQKEHKSTPVFEVNVKYISKVQSMVFLKRWIKYQVRQLHVSKM